MGRDWKKWAADRGLQKWFRKDNFIVVILMGILLVIIALPTDDGAQKGEEGGKSDIQLFPGTVTDSGKEGSDMSGEGSSEENYAAYLEERLIQLLSRMDGVGRVEVMITLKSSRELVVEKEQPVSRSSTNENDSQGGTSRTGYTVQKGAQANPMSLKRCLRRLREYWWWRKGRGAAVSTGLWLRLCRLCSAWRPIK